MKYWRDEMPNKIVWEELSKFKQWATVFTAILVAISTSGGLLYATYSHFQTDEEGKKARQLIIEQHAADKATNREAHNNDRIDRLERENARYEKDNLNPDLPQVERDFNNRQIKKNDDKIDCIRKYQC